MGRGILLILAVVLAVVLMAPPGVSAENPPQDVFDAVMMLHVLDDGTGRVDVSVKLTNPVYMKTLKNGDFEAFVRDLVYLNLLNDMRRRYENFTVILPSSGPVEVTGNWSARVSFYVRPFVVEGKRGMECPYSGPLDFVLGGKVYSFLFRRIILILPQNSTPLYAFPNPEDTAGRVFIWENATFLPMFGFIPCESPIKECRPLSISLDYRPEAGRVFFNATFNCTDALPSMPGAENVTYSINGNLTEVSGYLVPQVKYEEEPLKKEWKAKLELPFSFSRVYGGKVLGDGRTVEMAVEKTSPARIWIPIIAVVALMAGILWRWRR
ncbi:hypothetical protein A3L09_00010 [Thermococcus profundus]|uniref:Uncharacterized protein n=1 Tax=Thermococcus profundus TaxID=49899 RepID=A0A2Z2M7X2_THEPR|nr:hypothetical protein [Thermococcus profundus]ASJ01756.1 hypothetical protein A3L09_00010 [Thermococcus profundus]